MLEIAFPSCLISYFSAGACPHPDPLVLFLQHHLANKNYGNHCTRYAWTFWFQSPCDQRLHYLPLVDQNSTPVHFVNWLEHADVTGSNLALADHWLQDLSSVVMNSTSLCFILQVHHWMPPASEVHFYLQNSALHLHCTFSSGNLYCSLQVL